MQMLSEEIEQFRDKKWRREEARKVETALQIEQMVEELGFCLSLTDSRANLPYRRSICTLRHLSWNTKIATEFSFYAD